MATGRDRSHALMAESLFERLERTFELERIVGPDVKDPGGIGPAELLKRLRAHSDRASASSECGGTRVITNLLQEALEEDAADKRLSHTVVALGLLLASLNRPTTT